MKLPDKKEYWNGNKNKAVRWYFYVQRGLALVNDFRYLLMGIFGVYLLLKIDNPIWLFLMFIIAVPVLLFLGWLQVHHMAKVINWLEVEFASYWSRYSFDLSERSVKALEDINKKTKHYG
jgi:hypothetical protein